MKTIVIAKEAWLCSQLSIAKYSGGIDISDEENGTRHFLVVDGKGQPYQGKLIPSAPADLVDKEFLPFYRKLGRDKFISLVSREPLASRKGGETDTICCSSGREIGKGSKRRGTEGTPAFPLRLRKVL